MVKSDVESGRTKRTYAVYNKTTGEIVHIHHNVTMPGGSAPSEQQVHSRAIQLATRVKERNPEDLATLSIDRNDLRRGCRYNIDITTKKLRSVPV